MAILILGDGSMTPQTACPRGSRWKGISEVYRAWNGCVTLSQSFNGVQTDLLQYALVPAHDI